MTKKEEALRRRQEREQAELERTAGMRRFEQDAVRDRYPGIQAAAITRACPCAPCTGTAAGSGPDGSDSFLLICGIDEAGRGPLAGPVAAGACILPVNHDIPGINDSKKLSAAKREALYEVITREAVAWNVALASPERIDEINILQATYEAMREAVRGLSVSPDVLVNDAVTIPEIEFPQVPVIKGDAKCLSVAAASILAKVTRDRIMEEADRLYPEYGFAQHKGYGTKAHIKAIREFGPCPIHRRTFITHFI